MADIKSKERKYRFLIRFLIKTCAIFGIAIAILIWIMSPYRMKGNNMFPSIRDGDLCILYKLEPSYYNDVVLYEDANGHARIGRIVAIGGQTVDFMEEGGYEVNGSQAVEEIPYETYRAEESKVDYPLTLAEEEYFILNDFRSDTADSRQLGAVNQSQIKGKLLFLLRRRGF